MNKKIVISLALIFAFVASEMMTPRELLSDVMQGTDLSAVIPTQFGNWQELSVSKLSPIPVFTQDDAATADLIYDQIVMRTYQNDRGERVMLAIAYAPRQLADVSLHRPEVCYPAQGFLVKSKKPATIATRYGALPVIRLQVEQLARNEHVTYWMKIGNTITAGGFEQKMAVIKTGLSGKIADGMLFRISSVGTSPEQQFVLHNEFVNELLVNLPATVRIALAGVFA